VTQNVELTRSSTRWGLLPLGNVNRSKPARRVLVASILMLLFRVREKYPGLATKVHRSQL
jgi:hypothetical protein